MSLLEEMSITLADGSTLSFERKIDGWEVSAVDASSQLMQALAPHLMEAQELVLNCFVPLMREAPLLPAPQTPEESARLRLLVAKHLIYPFLRIEPITERVNVMEAGTPVRLVYTIEDGHTPQQDEDFELLVSTVAFAIQL